MVQTRMKPKIVKTLVSLSCTEKFIMLTMNDKLQNQTRWVALTFGHVITNVQSLFLASYSFCNGRTQAYKFSANFVTYGVQHSNTIIFFCLHSCLINLIGLFLSLFSISSVLHVNMKIFSNIYLTHHALHIFMVLFY